MTNGFGEPFDNAERSNAPAPEDLTSSEPTTWAAEQPRVDAGPDFFGDGPQRRQQRMSENRRIVLKTVCGVLVLFALGGVGAFLLIRANSAPIDEANNFLADVRAKEYPAAYAHTEPSCIGVDQPTFTQTISTIDIASYNLRRIHTQHSSGGPSTGTAGGKVTLANGDSRPISIFLTKFEGVWRVCGFDIGE